MNTPRLEWAPASPPTKECPYHHTSAKTVFGRFLLTWKGWKESIDYGFDETPWGEVAYLDWATVEEAQLWAERELESRAAKCLQASQTATERAAAHGYTLTDETKEPVLPTDKPIAGETPRTDAEAASFGIAQGELQRSKTEWMEVVPASFARDLERQLSEAKAARLIPTNVSDVEREEWRQEREALIRQLDNAKAEIDELRFYKEHRLPADWTKDSSLETWFPYTAQELEKLKSKIQGEEELRAQISALRSQLAAQPLPPPPAAMKGEKE